MRKYTLILFLFFTSCAGTRAPEGHYRVITHDESGEISAIYDTTKVDVYDNGVRFEYNGVEKEVTGSYKLERK